MRAQETANDSKLAPQLDRGGDSKFSTVTHYHKMLPDGDSGVTNSGPLNEMPPDNHLLAEEPGGAPPEGTNLERLASNDQVNTNEDGVTLDCGRDKVKESSQSFRTLVLIGVAAACAVLTPFSTRVLSNPEPSVASKLTEIVNFGSSAWPINKYCDIRNYPAGAIVVHEPDDTKARPSARGVACPLQWLPVLLTAASPSLSPPLPPTSRRRLVNHVFTSKAELQTAVQAFDANSTGAIATYGPIAEWDVSAITDMSKLFKGLANFDADISSWDTSGVTDMGKMFELASAFNQPLSFDTSSVTDMASMFELAYAFNQPLSFDTFSVTDMRGMFYGATAFNQLLSFDTSSVTDMSYMFQSLFDASAFNQPLSFDTSKVTTMTSMFNGAPAFNQPLNFDTSNVTNFTSMFDGTSFLSDASKLLIRCAWKGNSAFDSVYGPTWGPGDCPPDTDTDLEGNPDVCQYPEHFECYGYRDYYPNPRGLYRNQEKIPAGGGRGTAEVNDVNVTFGPNAFEYDGCNGCQDVPYGFDVSGCMWPPTRERPYQFKPRPVEYERCLYDPPNTNNCVKDPPTCYGGQQLRSEVKGAESKINWGKFVDYADYSKFEIVPQPNSTVPQSGPISKIFEFTWCPAQDKFQVTVYKKGHVNGPFRGCPYQFYNQTYIVVALQLEKALLQAEIDQLKAEKTGTIKVVFV